MIVIDAKQDYITCVCGLCVPEGQICTRCHRRTKGPSVENQTRRILTKES